VIGIVGKAGIIDPGDAWIGAEEFGDAARILATVSMPCSSRNAESGASTAPVVR
jgi:hypothetical protein